MLAANTFGYVAGGSGDGDLTVDGVIKMTKDHSVWSKVDGGPSMTSVTYGNGIFVGVDGVKNASYWSTDGLEWNTVNTTTAMSEVRFGLVSYDTGLFVALSQTAPYCWWSADGKSWTAGSGLSDPEFSGHWCGLSAMNRADGTYKTCTFVAVQAQTRPGANISGHDSAYTNDGKTWIMTTQFGGSSNYNQPWRLTAYVESEDQLYALGNASTYQCTYDGKYWYGGMLTSKLNELPSTSRGWVGVAYGNGHVIAINNGATNNVYVRDVPPTGLWTTQTISGGTPQTIGYGDGKFIIIAGYGKSYRTTDGRSFEELSGLVTAAYSDIAYGHDRFIAVGSSGICSLETPVAHLQSGEGCVEITTDHLIDQSDKQAVLEVDRLRSNTFKINNGNVSGLLDTERVNVKEQLIVNGTLHIGKDCNVSDFRPNHDAPSERYCHIYFGNGLFVATSMANYNPYEGSIFYSADGVEWTQANVPNNDYRNICYGNGTWIVTVQGSALAAISHDGKHWELTAINKPLQVLGYGNGMFVAKTTPTADNRMFSYSYDGVTWYDCEPCERLSDYQNVHAIKYGGGVWLAVCGHNDINSTLQMTNDTPAYRSFDGKYWFNDCVTTDNFNGSKSFNGLAWAPGGQYGTWVVMGYSCYPHYSVDGGVNWTIGQKFTQDQYYYVTYGGGLFCAGTCHNPMGAANNATYSYDGKSWFNDWIPQVGIWTDVAYGNGRFVFCGMDWATDGTKPSFAVSYPPAVRVAQNENERMMLTNQLKYTRQGTLSAGTLEASTLSVNQLLDIQEINHYNINELFGLVMELKRRIIDIERPLVGEFTPYIIAKGWKRLPRPAGIVISKMEVSKDMYYVLSTDDRVFTSDQRKIVWTEITDQIPDIGRRDAICTFDGLNSTGNVVVCGQSGFAYYGVNRSWTSMDKTTSGSSYNDYAYGQCNGVNELGRLVIVGHYTCICGYPDHERSSFATGQTFEPIDFVNGDCYSKGDPFRSVAYGKGKYICCAARACYQSTNGVNWTEIPSLSAEGTGTYYTSICYASCGRGFFVLLDYYGHISMSYDGDNWTPLRQVIDDSSTYYITYQNGMLFILKPHSTPENDDKHKWWWTVENRIFDWRLGEQTLDGHPTSNNYCRWFGANGKVFCQFDNALYVLGDEFVEEEVNVIPQSSVMRCIAYGKDKWISGGFDTSNGSLSWSEDGRTWYKAKEEATNQYNGVLYVPEWDMYFGVGLATGIGKSFDGANWFKVDTEFGSCQGILYSGGRLFAVGSRGIWMSADYGETWVQQDTGSCTGIAVSRSGKIIACGSNVLKYTTNGGDTWTDVANKPSQCKKIAYGWVAWKHTFVLLTNNGSYYSIDDGATWTKVAVDVTTSSTNNIRYLNGRFIVCAFSVPYIFVSEDGTNFRPANGVTTGNHVDVAYHDGKYIMTTDAAPYYTVSNDALNWRYDD